MTMRTKLSRPIDEQKKLFFALNTRHDVANLLEVEDKTLRFYLYIIEPEENYTTFWIPKKSGGLREISAPITPIKILQQKLNSLLSNVIKPKNPAHGFTISKSILSNAQQHTKQKYLFNIDIKDFFPSINFGRVHGIFMAKPFNFNSAVAAVLANLCCYDNQLPQGAPTSPIISNIICRKLDDELLKLATTQRCYYSRYADDLSFSTSRKDFPTSLALISSSYQVLIGSELRNIIEQNGFEINEKKVRFMTENQRQEVTGLIVNNRKVNVKRKYVRQIRSMLNAWESYGENDAEQEYWDKYNKKATHRNPDNPPPRFRKVVMGKIEFLGMVRGKSDFIYLRFLKRLLKLAPDLVNETLLAQDAESIRELMIIGEGVSDWKHLKAALYNFQENGHFQDLNVIFRENDSPMGDKKLSNMCRESAKTPQGQPTIFVFDRDTRKIVEDFGEKGKGYKEWGNNVFSFVLPIPTHRKNTPDISIEFYYKDKEIKQEDDQGRRLFISNEFNKESGHHNTFKETGITCIDKNKLKMPLAIIDDYVHNSEDQEIALPKNNFATNILTKVVGFDNFDFSEFEKIFNVVQSIANR